MASTSINNSRFMSLLSLRSGLAALEINYRRQTRFPELVQREAQCLQRRGLLLLAHTPTRFLFRLVAPNYLPAVAGFFQRAAKLLAVGGHLARTCFAHG